MLYLDCIIYSIQKFGGISTYFGELERGLLKHNQEFRSLYFEKDKSPISKRNTIFLNSRLFERYRMLKKDILTKDSILHSSYYRYTEYKSVRNVITIYDFTYERFANSIAKSVHCFQKKKAIDKADLILCISHNTQNDLLYYYPEAVKKSIHVTHLAASDDYYSLGVSFETKLSSPYILFVGARQGYKNFVEVVKALEHRTQFALQIVGGGKLSKEEIKFLKEKLGDRYYYNENIDNYQLNRLYNNAFCLIYPSLYEGFGIPVLEAMAAGCPVISSNISSIPEIAGKAALLLDEPNRESIGVALDYLTNKSSYNKIVDAGFENIKMFSWDNTIKKTIEGYKLIK